MAEKAKDDKAKKPKKKRVRAAIVKADGIITERRRGAASALQKAKEPSRTSLSQQLRRSDDRESAGVFGSQEIIEPPFPPGELINLIDREVTHGACCTAAAADVASRGYELITVEGIDPDEQEVKEARREIELFLQGDFSETPFMSFYELIRILVMDYKSVGWAGMEVLRRANGKIGGLRYVPAHTIRVKEGGDIYVQVEEEGSEAVHFIPFGKRMKMPESEDGSPLSLEEILKLRETGLEFEPEWAIEPKKGGKIDEKEFGKEDGFLNAANELIFIPCRHPSTTHYGVAEGLKAMSAILGSIKLNDYNLDNLQNKGIPRWALMIENFDLGGEGEEGEDEESEDIALMNFIQQYLAEQTADTASPSVLLLAPPGEVKMKWQRLSDEVREGSFQKQAVSYRMQILTAHHTPPRRLGIIESAHLGAGTGYSQWEQYKYAVIQPLKQIIGGWINKIIREGLLIPYFNFRFKEFDIRDEERQAKIDSQYLDRGVYSVNDVIEHLPGKEAIPGGDQHTKRGVDYVPIVGEDQAGVSAEAMLGRAVREIDSGVRKLASQTASEGNEEILEKVQALASRVAELEGTQE